MASSAPVACDLVRTHGSGNWGEQGDAAYYTIKRLPEPLLRIATTSKSLPRPVRRDIDVGPEGIAFVIDGIRKLTARDLLQYLASFAQLPRGAHWWRT